MDNALTPVVLQFDVKKLKKAKRLGEFEGKMKVFLCGEDFPVILKAHKKDSTQDLLIYLGIIRKYNTEGSTLSIELTNGCELFIDLNTRTESQEYTFTNLLAFCGYTIGSIDTVLGEGMDLDQLVRLLNESFKLDTPTKSLLLSPLHLPNPF